MPVPPYQAFMRPLLEVLSDGEEHAVGGAYKAVAERLNLTDEDLSELLPSGKQRVWRNRAGWAKTYLDKAGLVEAPRRGIVRVSTLGREALNSREQINTAYLERFANFRAFREGDSGATPTTRTSNVGDDGVQTSTPDEQLDALHDQIRAALAAELLEQVRDNDPAFFERLVVQLLVAMGYGGSVQDAGKALGKSGDNGIDGIIKQDPLGLDNVYVQAKKYAADRSVTPAQVRELAGALAMKKSTKGVLITTSSFAKSAIETAQQIGGIVLVDGKELADLMIQHDIGVTTTATYKLKRIDMDFFEEYWGS